MPRVISDNLYERLMGCVQQQRLLGVMGMLEEMQREAKYANEYRYELDGDIETMLLYEGEDDAKGTDEN